MTSSDAVVLGIGIVASVLAVANLIVLVGTIWFQWLSNSATLVASFEQQFRSDEMIQSRRKLALLMKEELEAPKDNRLLTGYWPVLSLYDGIGAMVRRKAIDERLVRNRFSWRIHRCYVALTKETNLLKKTQDASNDSRLYEEFEWLGKRIDKRHKVRGKTLDPKRLTTEYVNQEIDLTSRIVRNKSNKARLGKRTPTTASVSREKAG